MTAIQIEHLSKSYGTTPVVQDVSLDIRDGELFFLLGPSGCGKTTLLRAIAGFVDADQGRITFDDKLMNDVPARDRGTGMVFQNYALWPHMTVSQNIAFGLDVRRVPAAERDRRVAEAVALVRLQGLERQRPTQLSGGQQQRVALARALVIRPSVLLLDEPLSNLDARLRSEMRDEIRRVHRETRITTVYVTHDQKEALALADRIAVMHRGRVVQVGAAQEVYRRPRDRFIASFLGDANLIDGTVSGEQCGTVGVDTALGPLQGVAVAGKLEAGTRVCCCIRPESIALQEVAQSMPNRFRAVVESEVFLGEVRHLHLAAASCHLTCYRLVGGSQPLEPGTEVDCAVPLECVVVLECGDSSPL
jgi:iron(III) transport system ATP-binding protein